jgi:hypothetical protein
LKWSERFEEEEKKEMKMKMGISSLLQDKNKKQETREIEGWHLLFRQDTVA